MRGMFLTLAAAGGLDPAASRVVNIIGDHATYHKQYDAQLESDIETVARNVSTFIRWSAKTGEVGRDASDTVAAAVGHHLHVCPRPPTS